MVLKNHIPDETCDEILEWFELNKHLQTDGCVYSTEGDQDKGAKVDKDFKNAYSDSSSSRSVYLRQNDGDYHVCSRNGSRYQFQKIA